MIDLSKDLTPSTWDNQTDKRSKNNSPNSKDNLKDPTQWTSNNNNCNQVEITFRTKTNQ
jgi:hypothetical protein